LELALGQLDVWFLIRMFGNTGFGFCLDDWIFWFFWIVGFSVFQLLDCRIFLENLLNKRGTSSKELDGLWFFRMVGFLVRLFFD
jgi:hypothetical protein